MNKYTWSRGFLQEGIAQSFIDNVLKHSPTFANIWKQMEQTKEDDVHHGGESTAEHTTNVLSNVLKFMKDLDDEQQEMIKYAVLLHDAGKPETREEKDNKISFKGHEKKSQSIAEKVLDEMGADNKEMILHLIANHMKILEALNTKQSKSLTKEKVFPYLDLLAIIAKADLMAIGMNEDTNKVDGIVEQAKELKDKLNSNQQNQIKEKSMDPFEFVQNLNKRMKDKNQIMKILKSKYPSLPESEMNRLMDSI